MSAPAVGSGGYEPDEPTVAAWLGDDGDPVVAVCYALAIVFVLAAACLLATAAVGSGGSATYAWAAIGPGAGALVAVVGGRLLERARNRRLARAANLDRCRPVRLPVVGTVLVAGDAPPSPAAVAAIDQLYQVASHLRAQPDAGAPELLARVEAVCDARALSWRVAAAEAGVTHGTLMALTQGRMPPDVDQAMIEGWLAAQEAR